MAGIIFALMLVPVTTVIVLMQLFVPAAEVQRAIATSYPLAEAPSLQLYVLYLTSAAAHIIVSGLVIVFLSKGLRKDITETKRRAIQLARYVLTAVLVGLFLVADYVGPVLALISHERTYAVLQRSSMFAPYFAGGQSAFHPFSLLPASLIVLGLVVIVLTCISVARDLMFISQSIRSRPTPDMRRRIDLKIRSFHNYFYVLSSVLATSTIATTLFLKLPLTSILSGPTYDSFSAVSNAISVCWGVTFSLTMLAMCFYPYFRVQRDLRALVHDATVTDDVEMQRWVTDIQENYVIYTNLKSLVSIFVPAVIGALSPFM